MYKILNKILQSIFIHFKIITYLCRMWGRVWLLTNWLNIHPLIFQWFESVNQWESVYSYVYIFLLNIYGVISALKVKCQKYISISKLACITKRCMALEMREYIQMSQYWAEPWMNLKFLHCDENWYYEVLLVYTGLMVMMFQLANNVWSLFTSFVGSNTTMESAVGEWIYFILNNVAIIHPFINYKIKFICNFYTMNNWNWGAF